MSVKGQARRAAEAARRLDHLKAQGHDVPASDAIIEVGSVYLRLQTGRTPLTDGGRRLSEATHGMSRILVTTSRFVLDHRRGVWTWRWDEVTGFDDSYEDHVQTGSLGGVFVDISSTRSLAWLPAAVLRATGQADERGADV